ncbi:hypothetical protein B0189_01575 [Moraxella cuniculi]|nr:hypothetical protein B0189_01575 [Moraxella cuniculi]
MLNNINTSEAVIALTEAKYQFINGLIQGVQDSVLSTSKLADLIQNMSLDETYSAINLPLMMLDGLLQMKIIDNHL